MWMIELLEYLNFLLKSLHILDLFLGHLLHCSLLSSHLVLAEGHHAVGSGSQGLLVDQVNVTDWLLVLSDHCRLFDYDIFHFHCKSILR